MSKREELRQRRQGRARRMQLQMVAGIVLVAIAVTGWLIYQNYQKQIADAKPVGEFTAIQKETYPLTNGKVMGDANAKVVLEEFADFQCPICGRFTASVEQSLVDKYIATGKVRFEYHHFIVVDGNTGGTESLRAAEASECAKEQGDFWNYHKMVFANQQGEGQGAFADNRLKAFAQALGYDTAKFNACFDANRYANAVNTDNGLGSARGLSGTPSLFLNGKLVDNTSIWNGSTGEFDFAKLSQLLDAALAQ
jgi:protein-disulfide isomerase